MYIFNYIYIHLYIHIHIYICSYLHIYICAYTHIYIYTYVHIYIYTYIHIYIYTYIHIYIYTYLHFYIFTFLHIYIYIYYIYIYIVKIIGPKNWMMSYFQKNVCMDPLVPIFFVVQASSQTAALPFSSQQGLWMRQRIARDGTGQRISRVFKIWMPKLVLMPRMCQSPQNESFLKMFTNSGNVWGVVQDVVVQEYLVYLSCKVGHTSSVSITQIPLQPPFKGPKTLGVLLSSWENKKSGVCRTSKSF